MPYKCPMCGSESTVKERMFGTQTGDRKCLNCGHSDLIRNFWVDDTKSFLSLEGLESVVSRIEEDTDEQPMILFLDGDRWKVEASQLSTILDAMRKAIEMQKLYGDRPSP